MTDPARARSVAHDDAAVSRAIDVEGGRAQFAALYRSHFGFTWAVLRRLGVPPASVEDALQELWVTAHRRLSQLHSERIARAWLYGIARRIASHHRRSEQRHRRKLDALGRDGDARHESSRESSLVVEDVLDSLDDSLREAFVLSELEGWTAPEIAAATGANPNTVYWRVRTAKRELQSRLADDRIDAAVDDLRRSTAAPRRAAQHCWIALVPELGTPSLWSVAWTALAQVKLGIAAAVVAAGATVVVLPRATAEPPHRVVATAAVAADAIVAPAIEAVTPASFTTPAPVVLAAAEVTPPPAARPRERPAIVDPVAPAGMAAEDAALLASARAALARGDARAAQVDVRDHAKRFPDSRLGDLRLVLDVESRCALGDRDGARAAAGAARTGSSAIAVRLSKTCVGEDPR